MGGLLPEASKRANNSLSMGAAGSWDGDAGESPRSDEKLDTIFDL